jgi:hypothetical protein
MAAADRKRIPQSLRDELLRRAGEQCAICHRELLEVDKASGKFKHIADTAHIYPVSDQGERGNPAQRPADVDDISNLLPLCPNCHRLADWQGVGGRRWPLDELRRLKREHEAWIAFQRARPPQEPEDLQGPATPKSYEPGPLEPGAVLIARGHSYRLPWEPREGALTQQWSPERDAVRSRAYAYAETGEASHAWLRQVAARDGSPAGARWRREVTDEAALLIGGLPQYPGLPQVLAVEVTPNEVTLVTALPSAVSLRDQFPGTGAASEEDVRILFAGLSTLCAALSALHDAGFAHAALDPAAIFLGRHGNLMLRDLGLATEDRATQASAKADDVTTLARIVYACVTGVPPLTGTDGPPVPASVHNPAVPEHAANTLTRALTGDIRDARVLARQLRKLTSSRRP